VGRSGRTILFVSHNMAAVENLCKEGILMENGRVAKHGSIGDVITAYQSSFGSLFTNEWKATKAPVAGAYLKNVVLNLKGEQPNHYIDVICLICSQSQHKDMFVAFDVINSRGITILQAIPHLEPFIKYSSTDQRVRTEIDLPPLIPDHYKVSVWLGSHNTETICWEKEIVGFEIYESPTKGRNFPHSHHNGFLVPRSRIVHG